MSTRSTRGGSVGSDLLWMVGLSILLFWLPTLGPLVPGFVGGRKAGGIGPAFVAAIIPAVLVAALIFLLGTLVTLPVIGALVGRHGREPSGEPSIYPPKRGREAVGRRSPTRPRYRSSRTPPRRSSRRTTRQSNGGEPDER
jgi:hypothetical protein